MSRPRRGGDDPEAKTPYQTLVERLDDLQHRHDSFVAEAQGRIADLSGKLENQAPALELARASATEGQDTRRRLDLAEQGVRGLEGRLDPALVQHDDPRTARIETLAGGLAVAEGTLREMRTALDSLGGRVGSQATQLAAAQNGMETLVALRGDVVMTGRRADEAMAAARSLTSATEARLRELSAQVVAAQVSAQAANARADALASVLEGHTQTIATVGAQAGEAAALRTRVNELATALAASTATARAATDQQMAQTRDSLGQQIAAQVELIRAETAAALDGVRGATETLAGRIEAYAAAVDPAAGELLTAHLSQITSRIDLLHQAFIADPALATALTRKGLVIADGNVTSLAAAKLTGDVATARIQTNVVAAIVASSSTLTGAKLTDTTVDGSTKLIDASVSTAKIADLGVTTAKLADVGVTTGKLADQGVTTGKIADVGVTTAKLADANVTTAKLADANVTTAKIADAGVTTAKIADAGVVTAKIADVNVTTAKLANAAVTDAKIADVAATKLTAGALAAGVTLGGGQITGNLALAGGQNIGVFGAAPVAQQTRGGTLTNNVTSGGTTDVIADVVNGNYAADYADIRNNFYQLSRALAQHDVALRALGFLT